MNRLREIRFFKEITQPLLSLKTGIHQSRLSLIENGLVVPSEEEKKRLAKALRHKVDDIFFNTT